MKFDTFGTSKHGEGKSLKPYLSVHLGDLIEQIKKSVIYTLRTFAKIFLTLSFFLKILPLKDDELVMSERNVRNSFEGKRSLPNMV